MIRTIPLSSTMINRLLSGGGSRMAKKWFLVEVDYFLNILSKKLIFDK